MSISILDLPDEIWAVILDAGADEDMLTLQRTCRRLRNFCNSMIWSHLTVSNENGAITLGNLLSDITLTEHSPKEEPKRQSRSTIRPPYVFRASKSRFFGGSDSQAEQFEDDMDALASQLASFTFKASCEVGNTAIINESFTSNYDVGNTAIINESFNESCDVGNTAIIYDTTIIPPRAETSSTISPQEIKRNRRGNGLGRRLLARPRRTIEHSDADTSSTITASPNISRPIGSPSLETMPFGTRNFDYRPYTEQVFSADYFLSHKAHLAFEVYHSVSAMPQYRNYSVEELRFQDCRRKEKKRQWNDPPPVHAKRPTESLFLRKEKCKPVPQKDINGQTIRSTVDAISYVPHFESEQVGAATHKLVYHSICATQVFVAYSAEELRFQDYTMLGVGPLESTVVASATARYKPKPNGCVSGKIAYFESGYTTKKKQGANYRRAFYNTPFGKTDCDADTTTPSLTGSLPTTPSTESPLLSPNEPVSREISQVVNDKSPFQKGKCISIFNQMGLILKYARFIQIVEIHIADDADERTVKAMRSLLSIICYFALKSVSVKISAGSSSTALLNGLAQDLGPNVSPKFTFKCPEEATACSTYIPYNILSQYPESKGFEVERLYLGGEYLDLDFSIHFGRFVKEIGVSIRSKAFLLLVNKALEFCDDLRAVDLIVETSDVLDTPLNLPDSVIVLDAKYVKMGNDPQTQFRIYGGKLDMLTTDFNTLTKISLSFEAVASLNLSDSKDALQPNAQLQSKIPLSKTIFIDSIDPKTLLLLRKVVSRCEESICVCIGPKSEKVTEFDPNFEEQAVTRFVRLLSRDPPLKARSLTLRPPFLAPRYLAAFSALIKSKMPRLQNLEYLMVFDFLSEPDFSAYEYLKPIAGLRYAVDLNSPAITTRTDGNELDRYIS
ncbi:hypothetical protein TRVA0_049S00716 [Trichomonascus vanleenenianus]|uniref:uncharacterized protein n=1 Tax=Trichomonascus vanleenenianus TaxID=2268995 RepID=UPI003ECAE48A